MDTTLGEGGHGHALGEGGHRHALGEVGHRHALGEVEHGHTLGEVGHGDRLGEVGHRHTLRDKTTRVPCVPTQSESSGKKDPHIYCRLTHTDRQPQCGKLITKLYYKIPFCFRMIDISPYLLNVLKNSSLSLKVPENVGLPSKRWGNMGVPGHKGRRHNPYEATFTNFSYRTEILVFLRRKLYT